MNTQFAELLELPITEKLQLVEDLWDNIAATPEQVPVTDWQKEELARRKANYLRDPSSGRSWEEVKHYVRHRNG
ncbi:MAG: addiction module protein [Hormoscilla sp. GUM202]|nr:addiction module protein [Hormoscilla sp. GUM202]